jgi:hypothetical protein
LIPLFASACVRETPERKAAQRREATEPAAKVANIVAAGKVVETMDVDKYTYVQVDTGTEKIWAAGPKCVVKVGDQLVIPEGMPMRNYHSKTLDRDFDLIYFVTAFQSGTGSPMSSSGAAATSGMPAGHPPVSGSTPPPNVDLTGLEKPEGGLTVAEIYAGKADLADKEVTFRGKVVKYNEKIMGKNWLHVQDGSGDAADGTNDLAVTTDVPAKVGDTVLVTGTVHLDKDFGFDYKYGVIIEDAKVKVE